MAIFHHVCLCLDLFQLQYYDIPPEKADGFILQLDAKTYRNYGFEF